jgi:hypothetical protein
VLRLRLPARSRCLRLRQRLFRSDRVTTRARQSWGAERSRLHCPGAEHTGRVEIGRASEIEMGSASEVARARTSKVLKGFILGLQLSAR